MFTSMTKSRSRILAPALALLMAGARSVAAQDTIAAPSAGEYSQWCGRDDRNRVAQAKNLADSFDEISSTDQPNVPLHNVKWVARLGESCYGSPVVAGGKVYIGGCQSNSGYAKALGILWCFRESDGTLLWKLRTPYIEGLYNRGFGITSTPTVESDNVYLLGQLGEVLCLNANGLAKGNTGPFQEEESWLATGRKVTKNEVRPDGQRIIEWSDGTPGKLDATDADIIWRCDMIRNACCVPSNALNAAILVHGDYLYVPTCSAMCDYEHKQVALRAWIQEHKPKPYPSPNLMVLDKKTGALLAWDETGAFARSFHGAHASPAWGTINGKEQLVWGSGDGVCYGFDPQFVPGSNGKPGVLKTIWQFDCKKSPITQLDDNTGKLVIERMKETIATPVIYRNRVYIAIGNDLINTGDHAHKGRLICIDATKTGDITETGCLWKFDDIRSSASTVAIADGLLYSADASGMVYCLDAETGNVYWTHKTASVWASPLLADGKVYVPTYGKGLLVLAAGKEKKVIFESPVHSVMAASPAVANGVLYFANQRYLYAVQAGAQMPRPSSK